MASAKNEKIINKLLDTDLTQYNNLLMLFNMARNIEKEDLEYSLILAEKVKNRAKSQARKGNNAANCLELYKKCLLFRAPYKLDDYILYVESNREPRKQFYLPRRKVLKVLVDDLQDLADGKIYFLGISLPPRVGKSTLCIFFMTWIMGRNPDAANVMSGHSDKLTKGFYQEILSIIEDDVTYLWQHVFPGVLVAAKNQQDETIDLKRKRRFSTITCRSITGTLTGAVEVGRGACLYCDDLIEDLEEALNIDRLDKKFDAYLNQLRDRMLDGAFELMVGTRWSVLDVLGRIQEKYGDDPKYRFRVIPALNENDESNFQYDFWLGFSTEYYHKMREDIDQATWWAKFMGQPYVREGLLFPKDELKWYNGIIPPGECERISCCDVAFGGGDNLSSPIAYIHENGEVYIHDAVYNKGDKTVTEPLIVGTYMQHDLHIASFEADNGGEFYAEDIDRLLRAEGYHMNITSHKACNQTEKMARIIRYAPDIRKFNYRNDDSVNKEYKSFIQDLTTFVQDKKGNKHDDAPDSLRMLAEKIFGSNVAKAEPMRRPW